MKGYDCRRAIAPHFSEELVVTNIGAVRHEWQALRVCEKIRSWFDTLTTNGMV